MINLDRYIKYNLLFFDHLISMLFFAKIRHDFRELEIALINHPGEDVQNQCRGRVPLVYTRVFPEKCTGAATAGSSGTIFLSIGGEADDPSTSWMLPLVCQNQVQTEAR